MGGESESGRGDRMKMKNVRVGGLWSGQQCIDTDVRLGNHWEIRSLKGVKGKGGHAVEALVECLSRFKRSTPEGGKAPAR